MAETILFNVADPTADEVPANTVDWYQSPDGETWGATPVDTIAIADLPIGTDGRYAWTSELADPTFYHLLKTRSALGVVSSHGVVVAPSKYNTVAKREINNYGQPLVDPEGKPIEGVKITFRLWRATGPDAATDRITGETITSVDVSTDTDANGEFAIQLWPTDRCATARYYLCTTRLTGIAPFLAPLPAGDTPLLFSAMRATAVSL